jgi:hypothetical protein
MNVRFLVPIIMLALAALACSPIIPLFSYVDAVMADTDQPGHVSIRVRNGQAVLPQYATEEPVDSFFSSTDYGQTWMPTAPFEPTTSTLDLTWDSESLVYRGVRLWSFPRSGFRGFFYEWANDTDRISQIDAFKPELGAARNVVVEDVLYIALGTEGLLVGPAPNVETTRVWELRQTIPGLQPMRLNFADPFYLLGVLFTALFIPPLPLIHAYFLSRSWRTLMPSKVAWARALDLSIGLALLTAAGIILWIVPTTFDIGFYPLTIGMSIVVVVISTLRTIHHARAALLSAGEIRIAAERSVLASIIVPLGVLAVWWLWGIILIALFVCLAEDWRPKELKLTPMAGISGAVGAIALGVIVAAVLLWAQWVTASWFASSMTSY